MRSKTDRRAGGMLPAGADRARERIRVDLERRGVPAGLSGAVAERLAEVVANRSPQESAAAVAGAAAAFGIHQREAPEPEGQASREADVEQIQRLMRGFAGELRKLEEGLRILSAYVSRMHDRAARDEERTLH